MKRSSRRDATSTRVRAATAEKKALLDKQHVQLDAAQAKLADLERRTAKALVAQQAQYAEMAADKVALEAAIAKAAAAQAALAKEIKAIVAKQAQQGSIPSAYNGTLKWPMSGTITQEYGCTGFAWEPPQGNCRHFHKGIDIAAPLYTPIKAAGGGRGRVRRPEPVRPLTQGLDRRHRPLDPAPDLVRPRRQPQRSPIPVKAGQSVRQGQVIAYNGLTGRTTGPHLHWMVELDDKFVNPRLFL